MGQRRAPAKKRNVRDMGNAANVLHTIKPINVIRCHTVSAKVIETFVRKDLNDENNYFIRQS